MRVRAIALARDVLDENVLPTLGGNETSLAITPESMGAICIEIGSFFRDHDWPTTACNWDDLAERFLGDPAVRGRAAANLGRALQHKGMALLGSDASLGHRLIESAKDLLGQHTFGATNSALWMMKSSLGVGHLDEAAEFLRSCQARYGPIDAFSAKRPGQRLGRYSWWTFVELILAQSDWEWAAGKKQRSVDLAREAWKLLSNTGLRPSGLMRSIALDRYERTALAGDSELWIPRRARKDLQAFHERARRVFELLRDHNVVLRPRPVHGWRERRS